MGSQTLEILRQGVWASLTGGWFYDPHQSVVCNAIHLYLWLFLVCSPFVAYLYFPGTWLTWCIYCVLTSLIILLVKLANMALHRLYDRAQTISEANLKHQFFKITKETEPREDETGIELKVMGNDGLHNSVEQAINEASEENSMLSMENVNSIIDLKVDVHRKNSSESIELMFYADSMISGNSQQDQQSLAGSASVSKSLRSANAASNVLGGTQSDGMPKYLSVYPEHEPKSSGSMGIATGTSMPSSTSSSTHSRQPYLLRKSSEEFKRRHQRRRLERQSSLDANAESAIVSKLLRQQSDIIASTASAGASASTSTRNESSFLHPVPGTSNSSNQRAASFGKSASASKVAHTSNNTTTTTNASSTSTASNNAQRLHAKTTSAVTVTNASANAITTSAGSSKSTRLQRHRSSETHDERLKQQNRGLFLFIHHKHQQHPHGASSGELSSGGGGVGGALDTSDELDLDLGGSASGVASGSHLDPRVRTLQSWILGSSSDVFIEDDSYTKSDFSIEQLEGRASSGNSSNRASFLLQQQTQLNSHYHHQQQYRFQQQQQHAHQQHQQQQQHALQQQQQQLVLHFGASMRKDSNSTMSALQLPVAAPPSTTPHATTKGGAAAGGGGAAGGGMKRRRHSNATALFKSGSSMVAVAPYPLTVRRIKSAALEISCPRPSVSNLSPHPNSVEAINGQQQIKNPASALLPPPSKCLVRNPHLNLCPKFGGSFGGSTGSGNSLSFGASTSGSTNALIGSHHAIVEQADEKGEKGEQQTSGSDDLKITDIDAEEQASSGGTRTDLDADAAVEADNDDDDDEVDDVPVRRRHKALGCSSAEHHSAESDVGDILADDDEFKDFDDNLEHILNDLQQKHNDLDDLQTSYEAAAALATNPVHPLAPDAEYSDEGDAPITTAAAAEAACSSQTLRQRLHSTDSETDNNGSRSPLLSAKHWDSGNAAARAADKAMCLEIAAAVQRKSKQQLAAAANYAQQLDNTRGEGDSGCPSSDCEQVSASSKDMLLAGMDAPLSSAPPLALQTDRPPHDVEAATENEQAMVSTKPSEVQHTVKSLGAIPKVVKYREVDETSAGPNGGTQLHKRRSGSQSERALLNASHSKATSRTSSSSTSSRSISADSFSADMHKMLWLMHGGAVDERGRPIAGIAPDGTPIAAQPHVVPPNMSTAHFQFYQEAIQALNTQPAKSTECLTLSERAYHDRMRRSAKELCEPISMAATGGGELQSTPHPPIGVVVSSSTLPARNAATLSIQGLLNAINDERQTRAGGGPSAGASGGAASASTVLNVDAHNIESYCEYWRPACMLAAEQPSAPRSFYKYHFQCCGYTREFKISMDRLELLALFDRDLHWLHVLLSVMLCALVACLGATILQLGYYQDLCVFLFCVVVASAQYSLIKSVQPDAASPVHGFNKLVAYSRAIYFSLCAGLLLCLERLRSEYAQRPTPPPPLVFFGVSYSPAALTQALQHCMYVVLLCFPLIFSLGLCPQFNTFLMYTLEQLDMHVFGGNAAGSLLGAFLCVFRSLLGVALLYGPLYAALAERRGTQYIVFSIFCAMLIPLGYHLSRAASDFSHLWALIKHCIVSTYRDDDDELSANSASVASSQKLATSTPQREQKEPAATLSTEHIEMSSLERMEAPSKSKASSLGSSSQTLAKTMCSSSKKAITASSSCASLAGECQEQQQAEKAKESANDHEAASSFAPAADNDDISDKASTSSTTNACDISTLTAGGAVTTGARGAATACHSSDSDTESPDPLPKKLQSTVHTRLKNDLVVTTVLGVVVLGLHCSTVFTVLQPDLNIVLYAFCSGLGLVLHYVIPQLRKHMPWLCFARPLLRQKEFGQFEVANAPKVMWFEKGYIYLCMVERNVMFPLLVISALTADAHLIAQKFGTAWGTLIVAVCALKFIRNAYSDPTNQYLIVLFTVLIFRADFSTATETFLIDYFFVSLAFRKCCDFLLKLQFIVTYIAPWQITWGSAFHAFAQPFSVPHSAMLFLQAGISAILSTPLNPFLGSAIFLTSYVRPIKFWERDYNTRRIDHSNTRLSSQLERDLGADDNNLNSIFYEHLTRSLQHSLCGDLLMGRWGNVNQGDCFVLASDYLNCLVHIIELGNGLCTFQMRGLEFRGTYCQQREVEAITEGVEDNDGCCCCDPGHLPRMLSANAMFSTRWLAWQVVAAQYVLEGYSISDNLASATLQVFEYRKVLITYYIKSIIYYVVKNHKLDQWLASTPIRDALQHTLSRQFVDLDPIFNYNLDEDFDFRAIGITRSSFCYVYLGWINFCFDKRMENEDPPAPTAPDTPAYNDSKSTPNLSSNATTQAAKSQSTQQLRTRPQKSATMSGSSNVSNHSSEHIAASQSFANISRQTSESAPGLSGVGLSLVYPCSATHAPLDNSLNNSSVTVTGASTTAKVPLLQARLTKAPNKPLRKEDSPTASGAADSASREKPSIKLKAPSVAKDSSIVSLCLALGLLARRSLATASHSSLTGVEFFLHGLHALFKGDFRITSPRDEWVFADMELLHAVVAPAVKMALKLQQDHITNPDEFLDPQVLYEAIDTCSKDLVISHEADPVWRSAVLRGAPNLLALRHVMEDGSDEYRIIRLTKRFLSFRVIKLNRECVRGLWAGQQQELIYLRNRNPERGSIQNAKQALRNIINSSCDQPIGYPIYVSPLTTSYADTNEQLCDVIGGAITLESIRSNVLRWWQHIRERCRQGCSSGSALESANAAAPPATTLGCSVGGESGELAPPVYISPPLYNTLTVSNFFGLRTGNVAMGGSLSTQYGSEGLAAMRMVAKPNSTTLLAGLLNREQEREREILRDSRGGLAGIRKSQTHSAGAAARVDRERRATLPIASTSLGVVSGGTAVAATGADATQLLEQDVTAAAGAHGYSSGELQSSSSPRYAKISCSSGSLGIGNIITTPGDYPRKSKGPICLTAAAAAANNAAAAKTNKELPPRLPCLGLNKKVIIVDATEIYECMDMDSHIDFAFQNKGIPKAARMRGSNWVPRVGMVGYVVHHWQPNHADPRYHFIRSRIVYLVDIGEHYVSVGEYGLREYNQVMGGYEELPASRISMQLELAELPVQSEDEHDQQPHAGLTPILGSSLESPTSQLASSSGYMERQQTPPPELPSRSKALSSTPPPELPSKSKALSSTPPPELPSRSKALCSTPPPLPGRSCGSGKPKIQAVSSSSSEDEIGLNYLELQRRDMLLNMWRLLAEKQDTPREHSPELEEYDDAVEVLAPVATETPELVEQNVAAAVQQTAAMGAIRSATQECIKAAEPPNATTLPAKSRSAQELTHTTTADASAAEAAAVCVEEAPTSSMPSDTVDAATANDTTIKESDASDV